MKNSFMVCLLCSLVMFLFACTPEARRDSVNQGSEEAEMLRQRYQELGRQIQEEEQRIARRDPEFDIAGFIQEVEHSVEPAFEHARVSAPSQHVLGGRYMRTRINVGYVDKDLTDILEYLRAIENHKAGIAVHAIELGAEDEEEEASFEMRITFLAVTPLPSEPAGKENDDPAAEGDAGADEASDLEALRQMVDERTAELAALAGENPRSVVDVLRELSRVCHGGELPSQDAEEPVALAADMLPLLEPSGPWGVHVSELQMQRGRVEIVGSAADYQSVNKLRRALEESPAFRDVTLRGTRVVEDGRTALKIWLYVEQPPQPE